ncbi:MAG TPA: oxidoreductase [Proteobacteria bacterium]|nr:oxidoreductase [Pseudomonadota bacterium]
MVQEAVKVAVVGSGYWGRNLVRNFYQLGVLAAVCDRSPESLQSVKHSFPEVLVTSSYDQILSDSFISAIAIATPAEMHYPMVCKALAAGKDVFVEKPLSLTADYGEDLVRRASAAKAILMVGHLLWYHPAVLKIKEMIDAGLLGRLQYIYSNRLNLGKIRREENILWSFAPHDISVILGLVGETPDRVTAGGGNFLNPRLADVTLSQLSFPSGVQAHIFVSWLHPFKEQRLVVVGERCMVVFNDTDPDPDNKLLLYPHTIEWRGVEPVPCKAAAEKVPLPAVEPLREELKHFLACLVSREQPRTDGLEGVAVLKVLEQCQLSLSRDRERGKTINYSTSARLAYDIHPTAVVEEGVTIGAGVKIWHFSHLMKGCEIGENSIIGQNVVVAPNVKVGRGCKIQNNVSLFSGVELADEVFLGPSMVFTNVINPRAHISRKHEFRRTRVGYRATIGANATVVCGNDIGRYAFVGAAAVVTHAVPDHALVLGNPARQAGWVCDCNQRLVFEQALALCPDCGRRFRLVADQVFEIKE